MNAQIENTLVALAGDVGSDTVTDLIALYVVDAPRHIADIRKALASRDANLLRRAAHTLKSTAATVGALPLTESCKEIERLAQEGRFDDASRLLDPLTRLESESRAAVGALKARFAAAALAENR